jgi:hypothetical protein
MLATDSFGLAAAFSLTLSVTRVAVPPNITACGPWIVNERSGAGTFVGATASTTPPEDFAAVGNATWALGAGAPAGLNISAAGVVSVTDPAALRFIWTPTLTLPLIATNNLSPVGLDVANATCNATVTLRRVAHPPRIGSSILYGVELSPVGTILGNVNASDIDN